MSNKILNLDLSKDPIMPAIVYGRVGDDRLQTVTVNLSRRDEVADLTGYKITFEGTTYNGKTKVFDSENVSTTAAGLKKGTFDYTFPNMAFAVAGKYEQAYFSIVKDGKRDSTAGFEIYVDGNADIDAPEAETIITEYNKLVAELNELQKQAITELNNQQNQAINEMNQNFTAAQERIVELDIQISALRDQIEQALTDFESGNFWTKEESFNKEESSANVIYQVIGKDKVRMTFPLDFKDKVAGSNIENPHAASAKSSTTLLSPNSFVNDANVDYPKLSAIDGNVLKVNGNLTSGYQIQMVSKFNIIESFKRELGETLFLDRGATELTEQVELLRNILTIQWNVWGFGSGPSGYKFSVGGWSNAGAWTGVGSHPYGTPSRLSNKTTASNNKYFIDDNGFVNIIAFAEASDGSTPSIVSIDYANLDIIIDLSVNEHIKSMIAHYSGKNFEPATPEEIIVGERDDVVVTPKGLKDAGQIETALDAYRVKYGKQMVWGENHQVEDPATPNFGAVYASTDNEYKTIPATENYFTYDSKGLIVVAKDGQYKVSANVKRQWRTSVALWHYVSLMLNRGGSISKWDFSPFGGTTQNRNRQQCQAIITLKAGDTIYFTSESNNSTNALQFLNIDQFTMERLGD
ncbi:BppU family phage baseplate upper protein [Enterococcus hulanensis]|uniref:BppU family phage baseplate upper protein n=1 Tax=Enterococcus hulanensis TaxID=2559929 RepID=UPI0010F96C95|nr:BppU family phage baseplate upper protein [Enterococcus hulanensis]